MQNTRVSDIAPFFDVSTYSCEHECGKVCVWSEGWEGGEGGGSQSTIMVLPGQRGVGIGGGGGVREISLN